MILARRELAQMTVGTGETRMGQLPPEELRALSVRAGLSAADSPAARLRAATGGKVAGFAKCGP
jgi:hypothetical protein